jgi:hypothetical protein
VLCAQFDSPFALFAGATLVVLFLGILWSPTTPDRSSLPYSYKSGPGM